MFNKDQKDVMKSGTSWIVTGGVLLLVVGAVGFGISALLKPAALVSKVTDPNKIIQNYEWFHEANTEFQAKVSQIQNQKQFLASESDSKEKVFLRTELNGMQQSCRELVAKYNANSEKITVGIYKGITLPQSLSQSSCE